MCKRLVSGNNKKEEHSSIVVAHELVVLKESYASSHTQSSNLRMSVSELESLFEINDSGVHVDDFDHILLLDDIYTQGNHFKACKNLIKRKYPNTDVVGYFYAKTVFHLEKGNQTVL